MSVIELHCWIIVPRVGQHRRLPKLPLGLRTAPLHPAGHLHRRRHHLLREKRTLETVFEKETL